MSAFRFVLIVFFIIEAILPAFVSAQVKVVSNNFVPMAVWADGRQTTRLQVELYTGGISLDFVTAITLVPLIVDGVQSRNPIQLYDDGTHGDPIAGDAIYSRTNIAVPTETIIVHRDRMIDLIDFFPSLAIQETETGEGYVIPYDPDNLLKAPSLGIVYPNYSPQVYDVALDVRMSDRVVNIQTSRYSPESFFQSGAVIEEGTLLNNAVRRFYQLFNNDYDFIFLIPDSMIIGENAAHTLIANNVQGIGLEPGFDRSAQVGSGGRLKSIFRVPITPNGPYLRMIMRQWGVYLSSVFGFGGDIYPGTWGLSGVNGILGGYDPSTFHDNFNGTVDVRFFNPEGVDDIKPYSDLELYLAGMLPVDEVPPVQVIQNGRIESVGFVATIRLGTISYVTIEQIVDVHGSRYPAYEESQKEFRAAFLVLSSHRFENSELAYFHAIAEHISKRNSISEVTFFQATHGEGFLDTMLGEFKDPAYASIRVPLPTPTPFPGDINDDGRLRLDDVLKLGNAWNREGYRYRLFDLNRDNRIDWKDLFIMISTKQRITTGL